MTTGYRLAPDRYLDAIRVDSARFTDLLAGVDPAARVPSCPDWDASDLLWHLTEVQWFWATLLTERPQDPSVTEGRSPVRPGDHGELVALSRRTSQALLDGLGSTDDAENAWTWMESDQTVGFIRRRQAHEALIHRVDAEIVAGTPSELDADLATDGVDEAMQVMYGGIPEWATFSREHGPVAVRTSDTGAHWVVDIGRQSGVEPGSGEQREDATLAAREDDPAAVAEISADAGTLDGWLWGRLDRAGVQLSGDPETLAAFEAVIDTGID